MKKNILNSQKGVALIVALIILFVLTLIGIGAISTTTFETSISGNERANTNAFYAAEAGVQRGIGQIQLQPQSTSIERTLLGQGSSESYYQSAAVYLGKGPRPGFSVDEAEQGFKFQIHQVNATGDSLGAVKQIEVQVSLGPVSAGNN